MKRKTDRVRSVAPKPLVRNTAPKNPVRGKDWTRKFAGGDPVRLAAFKASTAVRSRKSGVARLSEFAPDPGFRRLVAGVLKARYPSVRVRAVPHDHLLRRTRDIPQV